MENGRRNKEERNKRERRTKKNGLGKRAKPSIITPAIDVLIGEGEQNRKQKGEQKKKNREWLPNPAALDHSLLRPA